jgi:hypothetical protein
LLHDIGAEIRGMLKIDAPHNNFERVFFLIADQKSSVGFIVDACFDTVLKNPNVLRAKKGTR